MKILIANLKPDIVDNHSQGMKPNGDSLHFPVGLGILSNVLINEGYSIETYDSYIYSTEGFYDKVLEMKPDVIMMSGYLGNYFYRFVKDVSSILKNISPLSILILGGPAASTIPELIIENTDIDYVCTEEGEELIVELLLALQGRMPIGNVKGVYYRDNGMSSFTGDRDRLDKLSIWPEYDAFPIWKYIEYLNDTNRCWEIMASRGCTNGCTFCKSTFQTKTTFYDLESVMDHLHYVSNKYHIDRFNFIDDNFLYNRKRVNDFLNALNGQIYKWRCIGRVDMISPEMISVMKKKGLFGIGFGLESGSQKMLDVYNKRINIKKIKDNLLSIRKIIDFHATFIVGGPGETWETIEETKKFIEDLEFHNAIFSFLTLFPGTKLYEDAIKKGIIIDEAEYCNNLGGIYDYPHINMSDMPTDELIEAQKMLYETSRQFGEYE